MGVFDLLFDREREGEEERQRETMRRQEEKEKLRRKLVQAFTGEELEPWKESTEKPEADKKRPKPRKRKEDGTVEEPQISEGSEHEFIPLKPMPESMDARLYRAVLNGDTPFFSALTVDSRVELQVSPQENTILHVAASSGREEIVEPILRRCFSLFAAENAVGDTPLHLAARGGHFSTVVAIVNCAKQFRASSSRDVEAGGWELEYMLTVKNNADNNALHEALKNRHKGVAKFLIEQEPKIWGLRNGEHKSPLYLAAEAGFLDLVNLIIDSIAKQSQLVQLEGRSPAIAAIAARRTDILKAILGLWPDLRSSRDEFGRIPLHYAAWFGYIEVVDYLLAESTADACQKDMYGLSPLHIAVTNGHVDVIKKLLEFCPYSSELLDREGENILHIAAECGQENIVSFILKTQELGSLINARDRQERTPLHFATFFGYAKIVSILTRDKRIDLKAMTKEGRTALDIATERLEIGRSFRRRLTWIALRDAGAPSAKISNFLQFIAMVRGEGEGREEILPSQIRMERYKERISTLLVVATLIATVTFAAGFTMPGGYNSDGSDKGVATLLKKRMFQAYVIFDTISMYSSIIVVVALIWAQLGDINLMRYILNFTSPLLGLALTMMSLAFMAGLYLAVSKLSWLGVGILVLGLVFLLGILLIFVPLWLPHTSKYRIVRYMSHYVFLVLLFVTGSSTGTEDDAIGSVYSAYMST